MSFGHSAGDYVLLVQLAHKTFRNCQRAGEEYVAIACEVRCLHSVLRTLRGEAQIPGSMIFAQDSASASQLISTANACKKVLENLENILVRYEGLKIDGHGGAGKKLWQKFKLGSKVEDLAVIREKMVTYTSIISIWVDTIQVREARPVGYKADGGSTKTAEHKSGQFERMRKEIYGIASTARAEEMRGRTVSSLSLSTYVGNEEIAWQDFRKDLAAKGFRITSLERHKYVLQAYMMKLCKSGLLDQSGDPATKSGDVTQWKVKKPFWEALDPIEESKISNESVGLVNEKSSAKSVSQETDCDGAETASSRKKLQVPLENSVSGATALNWDQDSTTSSEQDMPTEEEIGESASSSEAEPDDAPASHKIAIIKQTSTPQSPKTSSNANDTAHLVSSSSIVVDWLDKDDKGLPMRSKIYTRNDDTKNELNEAIPQQLAPASTISKSTKSTSGDKDLPNTALPIISDISSLSNPRQSTRTTVTRRRSDGSSRPRDAEIIAIAPAHPSQVGQWNRWNYTGAQTMSIDGAIAIKGSNNGSRIRHRDGERRRVSSRPPSTSSNWNEGIIATENLPRRHRTYSSPTRPQSMPTSPIRTSAPQIHQQQSYHPLQAYHIHSRSTPTSPTRSQPPTLHRQYSNPKSKVHYRTSATLIVDPPTSLHVPSGPRLSIHNSPLDISPLPLKGILKTPTERFPEESEPSREGVAVHKDAVLNSIPPSARWTKISRKLVNPEALEAGNERYEVLEEEGAVIVLRVVGREEIEEYAEITRRIRAIREAQPGHGRRRSSIPSVAAAMAMNHGTDATLFNTT